jgi:fumarate reductase flavoprotein subunit
MENLKADVVIVGSGAGGMAASLTAAQGGAKVIVLEKNRYIGGISIFPGEIFAVGTKLQRRYNIPVTTDEAFTFFMKNTQWKADARLVRAFIDKTASTISWLEQLGVPFEIRPHFLFPDSKLVAHGIVLSGRLGGVLKILKAKAESLGTEIYTSTQVKQLIKNNGTVSGLIAEDRNDKFFKVQAKAVIIASGGYSSNKEMVKKYHGFELGQDMFELTRVKETGEGIQMAWDVGAVEDGMCIAFRYGIPSQSGHASDWDIFCLTHLPYLWVNQKGVRFFNEEVTSSGGYTANALTRQKNKCAFLIFDNQTKRYLEREGNFLNPLSVDPNQPWDVDSIIKKRLDKKDENVFVANSLEELAGKIRVAPDVLLKTIDEYNTCCDKGHDDLFAKDPKSLLPVKVPPFYAFKNMPIAYGTVGGIKINEMAEVMDKEDEKIPGLYAAGDCANGAISYNFWLAFGLQGCPSSFALNTGRIAGENVLSYIKRD